MKHARQVVPAGRLRLAGSLLVILVLAVWALGANPFSGQTVAPLDLLVGNPGWSTVAQVQDFVHWESTDIIDGVLPFWISLKRQIRQGGGFLWNPYFSGGVPVTQDLLNPPFLLFLAVEDDARALYLIGLVKLVVSGFGCYLFLRTFLGRLPALWGGVVYMLCGFNAAWFFWDQVGTSMWIPWLLAATVGFLAAADRRWLPAITLASLLLINGAYLPVAVYGFYAFALLVGLWSALDFRANRGEIGQRAGLLAATLRKSALALSAVGLAFLISAAALLPFAESIENIDLGYRTGEVKIYGAGTRFAAGTDLTDGVRDFSLFVKQENPLRIERTAYVGAVVVVFAFVGACSALWTKGTPRRLTAYCMLLVGISVAIAFGLLPSGLIKAIPVFGISKWGRLLVITLFGLSALSAVGIEALLLWLPRLIDRVRVVPAGTGAQVACIAVAALLAFQFLSQKSLFRDFNAVVPAAWLYPPTPSIDYVKGHLAPLQSVIADTAYGMSGSLGAYGIPQWYAHSFRTEAEKKILAALTADPFPSPTSSLVYGERIRLGSPLMQRLGIKYLMLDKRLLEPPPLLIQSIPRDPAPIDRSRLGLSWTVIELERDVAILENRQVTGGAYFLENLDDNATPADYTTVETQRPVAGRVEIRYSGKNPGWIVLPLRLHRGWIAAVDGKATTYATCLGMMPAVPVAGACNVVFSYRPKSFIVGAAASAAGCAAFLIFSGVCARCRRKDGAPGCQSGL